MVAFALIVGSISAARFMGRQGCTHRTSEAQHSRAPRSTGKLEEKLKALGYKVTWTEFPAGPQLLEGLNVGTSISAIPARRHRVRAGGGCTALYVGNEPSSPTSEAILVPTKRSIKSVSDLKGSVWPSTRARTSITSWFERWRRRVFNMATSLRSFFRRPMRAQLLSQAR